jgi:hypothetical protein
MVKFITNSGSSENKKKTGSQMGHAKKQKHKKD